LAWEHEAVEARMISPSIGHKDRVEVPIGRFNSPAICCNDIVPPMNERGQGTVEIRLQMDVGV
jgi:hypothetical protein